MVKCLLPVNEANTQFFMYLQSSFCYYSHHPNCIPTSFSYSKSKLIFSKYSLNSPFNPSSKYLCYYLCCMCNKADCAVVAAFCSLLENKDDDDDDDDDDCLITFTLRHLWVCIGFNYKLCIVMTKLTYMLLLFLNINSMLMPFLTGNSTNFQLLILIIK